MRTALNIEGAIGSPGVGRWWPDIAVGGPLVPGAVVGRLERAGDVVQITLPPAAGGVAVAVAARGAWVEYGTLLVQTGESSGLALASAPVEARDADVPDDVTLVRAETDGTVYLRANPESAPFVLPGGAVTAMATIALVEVMKTFTPVRSTISGEIVRICVQDGAAVEAGEALFWLRGA